VFGATGVTDLVLPGHPNQNIHRDLAANEKAHPCRQALPCRIERLAQARDGLPFRVLSNQLAAAASILTMNLFELLNEFG
jgi:hypothetical protein